MTELARIDQTQTATTLHEQMDYARAVSTANLLPSAYRGKPADIMLAVGLGQAMGLSPAESLYRIDVIQGKPTASAELIAANVRKAGHILRLRVDEQAMSATCTIVRADDPDYEHTVTRDATWAKRMGLDGKDNYKKQPATMLGWRAVTACARMACPEALYGVAHTADEMVESGAVTPSHGGLAATLAERPATYTAEQIHEPEPADDAPITKRTRGQMFALFAQKGISEDEQLPGINHIVSKSYESRGDVTEVDALEVIRVLQQRPDASPTDQAADQ